MRRACIFAHFDRGDVLADYVLYSITAMKSLADTVIFVSTSALGKADLERLENSCDLVICRENVGYDFYSYRAGLLSLDLERYSEVILLNDSIYGPLSSLSPIFDEMSARDNDFWGVTDSYDLGYHIQSYFLVFRESVIRSEMFRGFWAGLALYEGKENIVQEYEVNLSQSLIEAGFVAEAFVPSKAMGMMGQLFTYRTHYWKRFLKRWNDPKLYQSLFFSLGKKSGVNQTHMEWSQIITQGKMPYLKVNLLRDDLYSQLGGREAAFDIIRQQSKYPINLIRDHLDRMDKYADVDQQ